MAVMAVCSAASFLWCDTLDALMDAIAVVPLDRIQHSSASAMIPTSGRDPGSRTGAASSAAEAGESGKKDRVEGQGEAKQICTMSRLPSWL